MIFEMLRWWYVSGWVQAIRRITEQAGRVERIFSFSILLKTLFAPWRRIISAPGKGLDAKVHAALDNLVSRCIGFVIRSTVVLVAAIAIVITTLLGILMAVLWPLIPIAIIVFMIKGITG